MKNAEYKVMATKKKRQWKTIIDFTKIQKGGTPVEDILKSFSRIKKYK